MITFLTIASILLALAIVGVVAVYLILIFVALKRGADHLQAVAEGLAQVRDNTDPLEEKVGIINGGLGSLLAPLVQVNDNLAAIVDVARAGPRR